jgi:hypothetical protein
MKTFIVAILLATLLLGCDHDSPVRELDVRSLFIFFEDQNGNDILKHPFDVIGKVKDESGMRDFGLHEKISFFHVKELTNHLIFSGSPSFKNNPKDTARMYLEWWNDEELLALDSVKIIYAKVSGSDDTDNDVFVEKFWYNNELVFKRDKTPDHKEHKIYLTKIIK